MAADGLVVPGVGAFAACMAGLDAVGAPAGRRRAGGRAAVRCWASASACRCCSTPASSTAWRPTGWACCPAGSSRCGRRCAAHGLEHRRRAARTRALFAGLPRTPASTSCTPTPRTSADRCSVATTATHGEPFVAAVENGAAVGHPVPPREVRRRRRRAARELAGDAVSRTRRNRARNCCPRSTSRDGQAVRLVQGEAGTETSYGDPLDAALAWQAAGAEWMHLVDLDAAFGRGDNRELLAEVVAALDVAVELSGGIRDDESLRAALATGCRG